MEVNSSGVIVDSLIFNNPSSFPGHFEIDTDNKLLIASDSIVAGTGRSSDLYYPRILNYDREKGASSWSI